MTVKDGAAVVKSRGYVLKIKSVGTMFFGLIVSLIALIAIYKLNLRESFKAFFIMIL